MSTNDDVIVFFQNYGKFAAIRKPYSARTVNKTYNFINSKLLPYRTWKQS